jgi:ketosteroid isomerase-like protein
MVEQSKHDQVVAAMRQITQAWLDGRVDDLAPLVHPEIVMVLPGFVGRMQGREGFVAGFRDFAQNAAIHEFREHDQQVDVAGDTAVVSLRYEMVYERSSARYRVTGRDLWVFQLRSGQWLAVWRTMLDLEEQAA